MHSCRIGPRPIPPCSPSRLVALSRCPDADCILPASAIGWNGTKVGSVIHRDLISKISGQNRPRVAPDIPPLLYRWAWLCSIFPSCARASPSEPQQNGHGPRGCPPAKGESGTWLRLSAHLASPRSEHEGSKVVPGGGFSSLTSLRACGISKFNVFMEPKEYSHPIKSLLTIRFQLKR